jgi:exosortase H (IPTLxxWG-CTERM-specific)
MFSRLGDKDKQAIRFVFLFFVLVLGFNLLMELSWFQENLLVPYTEAIARVSGGLLRLFGEVVQVSGTIIRSDAFAVDIRRGCDGVVATIILVSACLAFPLAWGLKASGVLLGYALIQVLNLIRIVGLFLLGAAGADQLFDFFHTYVSQFIVIALTMVFWIYWIGRERADSR